MKKTMAIITLIIAAAAVFAALCRRSAAVTSDLRDIRRYTVARYEFDAVDWITDEGHTAQTSTIQNVCGTVYRIDVIISSVTANPTVAITWADQNSVVLVPNALCAALADGTRHYFLAESNKGTQDADFNPFPHNGNITLTIDPSADPGGSAQTLTVQPILYVR